MIRLAIVLLKWILRVPLWRFKKSLKNPKQAQLNVLRRLHSDYLRTTRAKQTPWVELNHFHQSLPLTDYDEMEPDLRRQMETLEPVCTAQPILFYEKTSGSSGPNKLIPYTANLKRSFSRMFSLWVGDLLWASPALRTGKVYLSITDPQPSNKQTADEPKIGLEDDRAYLSRLWSILLSPFWVAPPRPEQNEDWQEMMFRQAATLVDASHLEVISVWSPSYLLAHLDFMRTHWTELLHSPLPHLSPWRQRHIQRRRQQLLSDFPTGSEMQLDALWPSLKIISCWDSAHSAEGAQRLRELFPGVLVQGKGLLATEAPLTIPFQSLHAKGLGMVPLIDEVYFEFEAEDKTIVSLDQVEEGTVYSLIISQQSGLLRYRMGDRVRVNGWVEKTPLIAFLGKDEHCSDIVGEKLSATFVEETLTKLGLSSGVRGIIPQKGEQPYYLLLMDHCTQDEKGLAEALDSAFRSSHHYDLARRLSQLGPVQVFSHPDASDILVKAWLKSGRKWGDMKPGVLYPSLVSVKILETYEEPVLQRPPKESEMVHGDDSHRSGDADGRLPGI